MQVDLEELKRRELRAKRFGVPTSTPNKPPPPSYFKKNKNTKSSYNIDVSENETCLKVGVVGTSQKLEKEYYRLTTAPNPEDVRPLHILKKAFTLVCSLYDDGKKDLLWITSQLKSIRLDLAVQHIQNDFSIRVYEYHARVCISVDDHAELQSCLASLHRLYSQVESSLLHSPTEPSTLSVSLPSGKETKKNKKNTSTDLKSYCDRCLLHRDEFMAYSVLMTAIAERDGRAAGGVRVTDGIRLVTNYYRLMRERLNPTTQDPSDQKNQNKTSLNNTISGSCTKNNRVVPSDQTELAYSTFALNVRQHLKTDNYSRFFALYHVAPLLCGELMEPLLLSVRRKALQYVLHAYRPGFSLHDAIYMLGFAPKNSLYSVKQMRLCISFLQSHDIFLVNSTHVNQPINPSVQAQTNNDVATLLKLMIPKPITQDPERFAQLTGKYSVDSKTAFDSFSLWQKENNRKISEITRARSESENQDKPTSSLIRSRDESDDPFNNLTGTLKSKKTKFSHIYDDVNVVSTNKGKKKLKQSGKKK